MTVKSLFLVLALAVGALWAPRLGAETYESYHCHCSAGEDETCSCSYPYTLVKSGTKEFRGYCDLKTENLTVSGQHKTTSCTIVIHTRKRIGGHMTKSCTNWSPFNNDHVSVIVTCKK